MKTIVKVFLTALMLWTGISIHAQEETESSLQKKRITFGIKGGLNLSNLTAYHDGDNYREDLKVGFNIGPTVDFHLSKEFYLQSGLILSTKGAKVKDIDIMGTNYNCKMNAMYLQVPIYFAYKATLPNSTNKIVIAGGPYFAYGIGGNSTFESRSGTKSNSIDTFDDWLWNKADVGIGLEVALELEKLVFTLGSDVSLTRVWKHEYLTRNLNVHNNVSYISIGYKF